MDLSVVIAVKNRLFNLRYCIHSILSGILVPKKIIIVDFGSTNSLVPIGNSFKNIEVIRTQNNTSPFHKSRAINIGIRAVKTKFLCVIDADQIMQPNFFKKLNDAFADNSNYFIRCNTYFLNKKEILPAKPQQIKNKYQYVLGYAKKYGKKPFGEGNCQAAETEWFLKVRGYDERYIRWGYEDSNLSKRAHADGKDMIYLTGTSMVHLPHPKKSRYFDMNFILKNLELFRDINRFEIIANVNKKWGKL